MPPTLRRATDADLPQLAALLRRAYGANADIGVGVNAPTLTEERIRAYVATSDVWVAERDGKLVGTVGLQPRLDVRRLAVDPEARGEGLAHDLMDLAERRAAEMGYAKAELGVAADHPWLADFYAKRGWRRVGRATYDAFPEWGLVTFEKDVR